MRPNWIRGVGMSNFISRSCRPSPHPFRRDLRTPCHLCGSTTFQQQRSFATHNNNNNAKKQRPHHHHARQKIKKQNDARTPSSVKALRKVVGHLSHLQTIVAQRKLPAVWETPQQLFPDDALLWPRLQETGQLFRKYLSQGVIEADGRHRREFSVMMEHFLRLLSYCSGSNGEAYKEAQRWVELMEHYRSDMFLAHYDPMIRIAAHSGEWKAAAAWYQKHVDPEFSLSMAHSEVASTVTGLYCVGRAAKEEGALPVETVFEVVQKLTMTNSHDMEKHILAAGAALGYLGEWEGMKEYLNTSFTANKLGQPLVAATMHTCVLSSQPAEALSVYDDMLRGELAAAAEWHWGGESDRPHPACRDLAMRALGDIIPKDEDQAKEAKEKVLDLLRQAKEENLFISVEALCGVIKTLNNGEFLEDMINAFIDFVDKGHDTTFVFAEDLFITVQHSDPQYADGQIARELGALLETVMVACNSHKKFALTMFCLQLFGVSVASAVHNPYEIEIHDALLDNSSGVVKSILPTLCLMPNAVSLVNTTMGSLCGVGAPHRAVELFETASSVLPDVMAQSPHHLKEYAERLKESSDPPILLSWDPVHRHLHRVLQAFLSIEASGEVLSHKDALMLSSVVATTLRECIAADSPETGIALGVWVERRKLNTVDDFPVCPILFSRDSKEVKPVLPFTDGLLSATVASYGKNKQLDVAETLIKSTLGDIRPPKEWLLSYHEAIEIFLAQNKSENATSTFRAVLASVRSPGLFCTMARSLKKSGNWRGIIELYRMALSSGCVSEELSLLAVEAITASGRIGQTASEFPLIRTIIGEMAKQGGQSPNEWMENHYWTMRKILGFSASRQIIGWLDYKTSRLDELQLAVESIDKRAAAGLTPKRSALYAVMQAVANHEESQVPPHRTGLPNVPRTVERWGALFDKVLEEANGTPLMYDPRFVDGVAQACLALQRNKLCVDFVNGALSRDVRVHHTALQCAATAAKQGNLDEDISDIRLLLSGEL